MLLHAELDKIDRGIRKVCSNMHSYTLICNHMLYLLFQGNK